MLLWFAFLGVTRDQEETFSYRCMYNLPKLKSLIPSNPGSMPVYVVHPAFRVALEAPAEPQGQARLL